MVVIAQFSSQSKVTEQLAELVIFSLFQSTTNSTEEQSQFCSFIELSTWLGYLDTFVETLQSLDLATT